MDGVKSIGPSRSSTSSPPAAWWDQRKPATMESWLFEEARASAGQYGTPSPEKTTKVPAHDDFRGYLKLRVKHGWKCGRCFHLKLNLVNIRGHVVGFLQLVCGRNEYNQCHLTSHLCSNHHMHCLFHPFDIESYKTDIRSAKIAISLPLITSYP